MKNIILKESFKKASNKYIRDIFINKISKKYSKNKRIEEAIKLEEKDDNDKKIIEKAIELEEKDDNDKKKVLNKLFNNKIKYLDILIPFLNNETKIMIKDENGNIIDTFELEFFPTYEECFKDKYKEEQREVYKEYLIGAMTENEISSQPSEIKNEKSKNNKNLGKKKKRESSK